MDTKTFLKAVLGDDGFYCIFAARSSDNRIAQKFYDDIDTMTRVGADFDSDGYDVYFGLGTLKTNENRKRKNVKELKSFYLDLDCGPSKEYASQPEAVAALRSFCTTMSLPVPLMVNSGRGVHVYWLLEEAVPLREWAAVAEILKQKCVEHKFPTDIQVTCDAARILRLPNTHNYKPVTNGGEPLAVNFYGADFPTPISLADFTDMLGGVPIHKQPSPVPEGAPDALYEKLAGNKKYYFSEIVSRTKAGAGCNQIRAYFKDPNNASEPLWRGVLSTLRSCTDGDKETAHRISKAYEGYSAEETDAKWEGLIEDNGAYRCESFNDINVGVCEGCSLHGKIRKPLYLGERISESIGEVEVEDVPANASEADTKTYIIPVYPKPYFRGQYGGVYVRSGSGEDMVEDCLYHNDLYLTRLLHDASIGGYSAVFRVHLPKDGVREFTMPMSSVTSRDEFRKVISTNGIVVNLKALDKLMVYANRWIDELQIATASDEAHLQFGWTDNTMTEFVLGDTLVSANETDYNPPSTQTAGLFSAFVPAGSEETYKKCLKFYNRPRFELHQFIVGTAFGSILMPLTGQNCMGLHLFGGSGVGKTTAMRAALGVYGGPEMLMNHHADTGNSRMNRAEVMKNLPLSSDEMTNITSKFASEYTYELSGGRQKNRMSGSSNAERYRGDPWQLIAVSSANSSIWQILQKDKQFPEAEMLRMLELKVDKSIKDPSLTPQTDKLFKDIKENYGWAGVPYIQYVINNKEEIQKSLDAMMARVGKDAGLAQEHRFWNAGVSATLTGLYCAKKLGLVDYDLKATYDWVINLLKARRDHLKDSSANVVETLNNYVFEHQGSILQIHSLVDRRITEGSGLDELVIPDASPRGGWVGRLETDTKKLYLLPKPLKKWCTTQQIIYEQFVKDVIEELGGERTSIRLGKGTHLNLPAARVVAINYSGGDADAEGS
jgi:hypothetical protein|tara:strand:+ start:4579 stop:7419 length:2841 start_codon:yes stop_codon:yes gene_type:complete